MVMPLPVLVWADAAYSRRASEFAARALRIVVQVVAKLAGYTPEPPACVWALRIDFLLTFVSGTQCAPRLPLPNLLLSGDVKTWAARRARGCEISRRCGIRRDKTVSENFGDFQLQVYADAVKGVTSRYPFDYQSIERKASEALPDWVYRYVSAAAGDGRTQRANIAAYSRYGIVPRMMVSPPERDLSIEIFGERLTSPIFMCPIGLVGLCAPDFKGDVAAARASAATGVPFTLSTFSQTPMEDVIHHAGATPTLSVEGPPVSMGPLFWAPSAGG